MFFSFQPQQNLIFYSNVSAPLRGGGLNTRYFLASFIFQISKHCLVMRPITLTSHCQESSRLARKLVGGLLLFLLFHPTTTTLEIKRHVRRAGTAQFIVSIHPPTFAFRVVCVCVVICTISLCTGRHVAAPCSSLFSSSWPSFHSLS